MAENKELYRFTSVKNPGDGTTEIRFSEGRIARLDGDPVSLTEQEVKDWSNMYQFSKATEDQVKKLEARQQEQQEGVTSRAEQQAAQAANADAQGPGAETSQVGNRSASRTSGSQGNKKGGE